MIEETSAGIVIFRKEKEKNYFYYYTIHQVIGILLREKWKKEKQPIKQQ